MTYQITNEEQLDNIMLTLNVDRKDAIEISDQMRKNLMKYLK